MTTLQVAEWCPDLPDLANATNIAQNVIPATNQSYGPLPALAAYSTNGLDGICIGGVSVQSNDSTANLFAGTADKLYRITGSSAAWVDVSGTSYSTASGDNWRFALFNNSVIGTNFGDTPQSFALGTSSVFGPLMTAAAWTTGHAYSVLGAYVIANGNRYVLTQTGTSAASGTGPSGTGSGIVDNTCTWAYQSGAPPFARHTCVPKNFLMLGNTSDPVGGLGTKRVWWSASNDATTWPAPGTNAAIQTMSDYNDFQGDFGEITGMADSLANADAAIFFQHAVWRGLFVGPPDVFDFFPAENVRGCPCPNSIVTVGAIVYYVGEDGIYAFDGAQSVPLGTDKFDKWFWNSVNISYPWNVIGAADVVNKAIVWAFPSIAAPNGIPDTLLIYRWDIQRASTAYLGPEAVAWLMRSLTLGVTLDGFSALGFTDLDTLPASLDSRVWIGGVLQLGAVSGVGKMSFFTGPNLAASVATSTVQLIPGHRAFVNSSRPLVQITEGSPSVAISGRTNINDPVVFSTPTYPNNAGECPQRNDNRYHMALVDIDAGSVWTHISGVELTYAPAGLR